jgi:hypothetical protein
MVNTLRVKKSPCKFKKSEKIKLHKKIFLEKKLICYNKQTELVDGREFGYFDSRHFLSFGRYEAIRFDSE